MPDRNALVLTLTLALIASVRPGSAETATRPPDSIIGVVSADWNGDGIYDRAILTEGEQDSADLTIYLSAPTQDRPRRRELALVKTNAAWSGDMAATQASLDLNARGALLVKSGNVAIGRDRWEQILAVVYRDKQFIVAGLTLTVSDTVKAGAQGSCDLNFLTGQGTRNGAKVTIGPRAIPLSAWKDEDRVELCRLEK